MTTSVASAVSAGAGLPGATDLRAKVSLTTPRPVSPTNAQQFKYLQQPITLVFSNAVSTGRTTLTYDVEVASDAGFVNKVATPSGIAQGGNGQTSVALGQLTGPQTYFWHVRADSGSSDGLFSSVFQFVVGPPIVIQAPALQSPVSNAQISLATLVVTNAQHQGPVGTLQYRFDVSTATSFSPIVFTTSVAEGANGQTSVTWNGSQANTQYYWRVQVTDPPSGITSPMSTTGSFTTTPPVYFDHPWTGNVELALRALLETGLAGQDGENGQAVIDQLNAQGGIYAGAVFQPHHDQVGDPTFGFGWFYVTYITEANPPFFQIVEYGAPPDGD